MDPRTQRLRSPWPGVGKTKHAQQETKTRSLNSKYGIPGLALLLTQTGVKIPVED